MSNALEVTYWMPGVDGEYVQSCMTIQLPLWNGCDAGIMKEVFIANSGCDKAFSMIPDELAMFKCGHFCGPNGNRYDNWQFAGMKIFPYTLSLEWDTTFMKMQNCDLKMPAADACTSRREIILDGESATDYVRRTLFETYQRTSARSEWRSFLSALEVGKLRRENPIYKSSEAIRFADPEDSEDEEECDEYFSVEKPGWRTTLTQ